MTDHRVPIGYANYNGDCSHLAGRSEPMGPNYMGELMWPVTADYDAASNKTRVGFSLLAPADAGPDSHEWLGSDR